ncbi:hypothetical protein SPBR_02211 [Sporothrix brasiliensis 5110]|uniref:Uncharacterized protein n=1 Tax=Sporothrix brasiliensis 5110 TaxID=1398154 RepID=A0A0C2J1Q4_9PEZI|nr:uncharacterized protein SPBR_02211 [Sporothrix brasiliensis 5110]KIH92935.1 hypothetical protein SPBR_02211 [Sporothrix brasiliensis 5110]
MSTAVVAAITVTAPTEKTTIVTGTNIVSEKGEITAGTATDIMTRSLAMISQKGGRTTEIGIGTRVATAVTTTVKTCSIESVRGTEVDAHLMTKSGLGIAAERDVSRKPATTVIGVMTDRNVIHSGRRDSHNDIYREAVGDSDDALFALDTRGDRLIWQFGTNDARRVPSYHRYRHGRSILGARERFTFVQDGSKVIFGAESKSAEGSVFSDKNNSLLRRVLQSSTKSEPSREHGVSLRRRKPAVMFKNDNEAAKESEFVSLRTTKKRRRGPESESDDDEADSSQSTNSDEEDDSESSSASSDDGLDAEEDGFFTARDDAHSTTRRKLAELNQRVKDDPQDVDAWLDLVDLQDQQSLLLGNDHGDQILGTSGGPAKTKEEISGISSVKMSIIESALRQVHSPSARERLELAMMREGAKVWTPKRLAQQWADLARNNASGSGLSFLLWKARLDFEMTNLSTLTVDGIKLFCVERLRALEVEATALTNDAAKGAEIYSQIIYVFLRVTRFMYDAGFRDLAAAAWQATLESSFARPSTEVEGASLGQFWDSEIQRIGEEGAQGWRSYAAKIQAGEDAEEALLDYNVETQSLPTLDFAKLAKSAYREEASDMDEYKPLFEAWVVAERQRANFAKLPARVIDDIDDGGFEDVFRVAVFSDLRALLFHIPDSLLPILKPVLVDAFLLFCQLAPAFSTSSWIETARNDPFLAIVVLSGEGGVNGIKLEAPQEGPVDDLDTAGRSPPELFYDGSHIVRTSDVLFSHPRWFRYLPDWLRQQNPAAVEAPVPPSWVANTLRQLVRLFGFNELALYSLAVDAMVNPTAVKKAARTLIKQDISNTALYEAYAQAEASRGNVDVARTVLASATTGTGIANVEAELTLRQTWAWIELESGQKNDAVRRLALQSATREDTLHTPVTAREVNQPISPAESLRLRHTLRTGMEFGISAGYARRAALFAQSFVLFEYLSSTDHEKELPQKHQSKQGNILAAMAIATTFSEEMQSRGYAATVVHEQFLQCVARIIYFHATHGAYRPTDLQAPLQKMVTLFPQNGIFLRLFAWIDPASTSGLSQLRPDNPLQMILDTVVLTQDNDCPSSRAFVIRHALQSGHGQGHAARAAFERALGGRHGSSDYNLTCYGNARLWQAFVHLTAVEAMASATVAARRDGRGVRVRGVDKKMVALAKDVYYRSVRACPGAKDVLLEAFGPNTGLVATSSEAGMLPSDLRAVFQTVVGKGLRVHIDLVEAQDRVSQALNNLSK